MQECVQDIILGIKIWRFVLTTWTMKNNVFRFDIDRLQLVTFDILQYLHSFKSSMAQGSKRGCSRKPMWRCEYDPIDSWQGSMVGIVNIVMDLKVT
jgi:hypothetical protein